LAPAPAATVAHKAGRPNASLSRGKLLGALWRSLVALGGVALGTYIMLNHRRHAGHDALPSNTELLMEVASVQRFVEDLSLVRVIDTDKLGSKTALSDAANRPQPTFGAPSAQPRAGLAASPGHRSPELASTPEQWRRVQ